MKPLPTTENTPVIRTVFGDDAKWEQLCENMQKPDALYGFQAYLDFIDDPSYKNFSVEQLLELVLKNSDHAILFVVDERALHDPEHPILVIDLVDQPGRFFRVIPAELWSVENNLAIANMDFEEFAENTDADGVLRGFA